MDKLTEQAEKLKAEIKANEKQIDNPALYISTVSALDFFIENAGKNE